MPRPFTLACIQFEPVIGALERNLATMEAGIRRAHAAGARLVVLPELADTGYVFESAEELASLAGPIPGGPSVMRLAAMAAELGVHVVSDLAAAAGGRFCNSAALFGAVGHVGTYRKLHLWDRETLFLTPGDTGLPVFDTGLGRIGMAICCDGWFPEIFRGLAASGAEIVCVPTN